MTRHIRHGFTAAILSTVLAACGGGGGGGGGPPAPAAIATLTPTALPFGTVTVGQHPTATAQLSNTGTAALQVTSITACGGSSSAFAVSPTTVADIAAGGSQVLTVTFTPAAPGAVAGCWNIATNVRTVQLTATGTGAAVADDCALAANAAVKAAQLAAQPTFGVKTKAVVTANVTFTPVAGTVASCPITLQFKDLNGNGTVEPYEDWRLTPAQRAADLVGRMTTAQKEALLLHPALADAPVNTGTAAAPAATVSPATLALVTAGVRFGKTAANASSLTARAAWANALQAAAEASPHGIPFVLSMDPAHGYGNGRVQAKGFSEWPFELSLSASGETAVAQKFGQLAGAEYRAIGVRMALSPSADLATDARWFGSQFTFGEDAAQVSAMVGAYIKGFQGTTLGKDGVACVVGHFPGAGPAQGGADGRTAAGKFVTYPGNQADNHLAAFQGAFDAGVAGVMPGYGIPKTGTWTALSGLLSGATIEQVGASFNAALLTDALRGHYSFTGLVVAPPGVLEDTTATPPGAPWGLEGATKAARVAKAVNAGVDQFLGLGDVAAVEAARSAGTLADAKIDAAAARALALGFTLGLFEDPYVDAVGAAAKCNTTATRTAALDALDKGVVLVVNKAKPAGWLNGNGNGSQSGDKGNAGNGTGLVLPAPPGEPYVAAGCSYYVAGDFNLDYVRSVAAGYGTMTNDSAAYGVTLADRMAGSDYIFIRIASPFTSDTATDAVAFSLPTGSLVWAGADNADALQAIADARAAIDSHAGSKAQLVVAVDGGRAPILAEVLAYNPSAVYLSWIDSPVLSSSSTPDKILLDVAFGIVNGPAKLPVTLPVSAATAASHPEDVAGGDGQTAAFSRNGGLQTSAF